MREWQLRLMYKRIHREHPHIGMYSVTHNNLHLRNTRNQHGVHINSWQDWLDVYNPETEDFRMKMRERLDHVTLERDTYKVIVEQFREDALRILHIADDMVSSMAEIALGAEDTIDEERVGMWQAELRALAIPHTESRGEE